MSGDPLHLSHLAGLILTWPKESEFLATALAWTVAFPTAVLQSLIPPAPVGAEPGHRVDKATQGAGQGNDPSLLLVSAARSRLLLREAHCAHLPKPLPVCFALAVFPVPAGLVHALGPTI